MNRGIASHSVFAAAATVLLAAAGCAAQVDYSDMDPVETAAESEPERTLHPFAAAVEQAHRSPEWRSHDAFAADVVLEYGGNTIFEGRLTTAPDAAHTHTVRSSDSATLVFDGSSAWVSPADAEWQGARFHALTWAYFLAAPHKLADPGAHLEAGDELGLHGVAHPTARLTFDDGIGDAPDDWYVIYRDPDTDRVAGMAYIVTFGKSTEQAEAEPHAITYGEYVEVDGVPIPTIWEFWNWNEEQGAHGDPIGRLTLSEPKFVTLEAGTFDAPEGAREEEPPPPADSA